MTLLALLLTSQTRWIVGVQVSCALHLCHPLQFLFDEMHPSDPAVFTGVRAFDQYRILQVMRSHPCDLPIQMAAATSFSEGGPDAVQNLRALIPRFPNSPSLYANLLRCESYHIHLDRPEIDLLRLGKVQLQYSYKQATSAKALQSFDQDAARGEVLDPSNAYFPCMRSIGFWAANRDAEAIIAMQRAGTKPLWNYYCLDTITGTQNLSIEAFGNQSALKRDEVLGLYLSPQNSLLRQATYLTINHTLLLERSGKIAQSVAIRHSLMRLGSLMRVQAALGSGTIRGIILARIATYNGDKPLPEGLEDIRYEPGSEKRIDRYCATLLRNHFPEEARQARVEEDAGQDVLHIFGFGGRPGGFGMPAPNPAHERGPFGKPLRHLMILWQITLCLLANIVWMLILSCLSAALSRTRLLRQGEPLPGWFQPIAILLFVVGVLLLGFLAYWQSDTLQDLRLALMALNGDDSPTFFTTPELIMTVSAVFGFFVVPIVTILAITLVCLLRRLPLASNLARNFSACALPIVCILVVFYGGMILTTSHQEKTVNQMLNQMQKLGDGPYYAAMTGKKWPGENP